MKIFPLFLSFCSFFLCTSTNINECKKLWGMNNEINGVTVSNIGIYMCIDDPLNIYSTINKPSNQLILSDEQLNIQNFNESVQRKLNNTINITNFTQDTIDIVLPTTTTTPSPTTTTPSPTTTTPSPTTTTPSPTTTTPSPTTTTKSSTTTTPSPTTITLTPTTTNLRINMSKSALNKNKESKIDDTKIDIPLIITITSVSILACILCCIRCNPLVYEFVKRRCTKKISITEKKELPQNTVKLNIKEKKQKKVTPLNGYNRRGLQHSKIPPPQVITPKRKVSLGFNTMGDDQDWYKKTFKNELSQFKDMGPPPSAPKPPTPKLPIPTLKADLIDRHVHANQLINNKMDNIINNIENTKKEMSLDKKYKKSHMDIREVGKIGKVQQRVNSIERKKRPPDFRNVRLNSWTTEGKKLSRDFN